jgi:hypothetical protein
MAFAFDPSSLKDVRENAGEIYGRLGDGECRWPEAQVERFRTWIATARRREGQ